MLRNFYQWLYNGAIPSAHFLELFHEYVEEVDSLFDGISVHDAIALLEKRRKIIPITTENIPHSLRIAAKTLFKTMVTERVLELVAQNKNDENPRKVGRRNICKD